MPPGAWRASSSAALLLTPCPAPCYNLLVLGMLRGVPKEHGYVRAVPRLRLHPLNRVHDGLAPDRPCAKRERLARQALFLGKRMRLRRERNMACGAVLQAWHAVQCCRCETNGGRAGASQVPVE
jgi:hypothetical protein